MRDKSNLLSMERRIRRIKRDKRVFSFRKLPAEFTFTVKWRVIEAGNRIFKQIPTKSRKYTLSFRIKKHYKKTA